MVRRNIPAPPIPAKFASVRQIDAGITKLRRRLEDVSKLNADVHDSDGPERETAQSNVRSTILEVFGAESPEYREHEYHRIDDGPIRVNMSRPELQQNFRAGIVHTTAMLHGLIARLEEKKLDIEPHVDHGKSKPVFKAPRVFIGHGRSDQWLKLKEFLVERLGLEYEEFNRESPAGLSTKERLQHMIQASNFAFLVMTSEDEHADGTRHARENVIHEIGLFQGAHSFERAIVLLEADCEEFSNIHGINQIRFPKGFITAATEAIRKVLEREGLITRGA